MRKILPVASALLVLALILAGCSGGGGTPTTPGPSVRGTWRSEAAVSPPVTIIVRDYLGSREMSVSGVTITCYFYSGEIQCSVYPGGSCTITAMPPEGSSSGSFIYAATMLGQNILTVQGLGEDPFDSVLFSGPLTDANTATGLLLIQDNGEEKWKDIATFKRS